MLITVLIHDDGEVFNILHSSGPIDSFDEFVIVEIVPDNDKEKTIIKERY